MRSRSRQLAAGSWRRSAALATFVLIFAGLVASAQAPASSLVLLVSAGDYPGETYTQGPIAPAGYVYFEGEPVDVDVRIANWGGESMALTTATAAPVNLVAVSVTRDDQPVAVAVDVAGTTWQELATDRADVAFAGRMPIGAGDSLRWRATVTGVALVPGIYRLDVTVAATDEASRPVRRQAAELVFEVRPRAAAAPPELARRLAERFTARAEFADARTAVEGLERLYPDSVAVHLIRSRIADAEGDADASGREIDIARDFLRRDRDQLFRRFARPGQIEDLVDSLAPVPVAVPAPPPGQARLETPVLDRNGDYLLRWVDADGTRHEARFVPADKIRPRVSATVSRLADGRYRYDYAIANANDAEQAVNRCLVPIAPATAVAATPVGWTANVPAEQSNLVRLEMRPLVDGSLRGIRPGEQVSGFAFTSGAPPGEVEVQCFGHEFPRLVPMAVTPEIEALLARLPGPEPVLVRTTGPVAP